MNLTSSEIFDIVWEWVASSHLAEVVPTMYENHYPQYPSNRSIKGEFIVINTLSNAIGEGQVATLNVNIYVPDLTPREAAVSQRYPDRERLSELSKIAYEVLQGYPKIERWFFDVSSENIISEQGIPYSFSNIKITFKKF